MYLYESRLRIRPFSVFRGSLLAAKSGPSTIIVDGPPDEFSAFGSYLRDRHRVFTQHIIITYLVDEELKGVLFF